MAVRIVDSRDPQLEERFGELSRGLPFDAAIFDWVCAIDGSNPPDFSLRFAVVEQDGRPYGLATYYRLEALDLATYAQDWLGRSMEWCRRVGIASFRTSMGFLAVPFSNGPGLLTPGSVDDAARAALYAEAVETLWDRFRVPAMVVRSEPSEAVRRRLRRLGFYRLSLGLPDAVLKLDYPDFESYYEQLDKKKRYKLRKDRETFAKAGGVTRIAADPAPYVDRVWKLYVTTLEKQRQQREATPPVKTTRELFVKCLVDKPHRFRLLTAEIGGSLVGFFLLVSAGDRLFVRHAGLDYERSYDTGAYFNLWYAAIEYAIEQGCSALHMGTTTYFVKIQLGAKLKPVDNHIRFRFKPLGRLLAFLKPAPFDDRLGSIEDHHLEPENDRPR